MMDHIELKQRRRLSWRKLLLSTWIAISIPGVLLAIMLSIGFVRAAKHRQEYLRDRSELSASAPSEGAAASYLMPANRYAAGGAPHEEARLVNDHVQRFTQAFEALGISSQIVGFELSIKVVPCNKDGYRRCVSQIRTYTTFCGCAADTLDCIVLALDSTGMHATVISSQTVTLAEVQP